MFRLPSKSTQRQHGNIVKVSEKQNKLRLAKNTKKKNISLDTFKTKEESLYQQLSETVNAMGQEEQAEPFSSSLA